MTDHLYVDIDVDPLICSGLYGWGFGALLDFLFGFRGLRGFLFLTLPTRNFTALRTDRCIADFKRNVS